MFAFEFQRLEPECPERSVNSISGRNLLCEFCPLSISYRNKSHIDLPETALSFETIRTDEAQILPLLCSDSGGTEWSDTVAVNVLVVDDEASVRELLVDILSANGYCASGVSNGTEALRMLRLLDYDMVVSDFQMPEMDGMKLMSHIKCLYPGTATILMTAEGWPEVAREARRRGAFDVIFKPFDYNQLLSVMKRGLQYYRTRS